MKLTEFYCVKCRKIVNLKNDDICITTIKNKKIGNIPALKGNCKKCDTNLTKFVKISEKEKLMKKFDKC